MKIKHRQINEIAQGHTADEWQGWCVRLRGLCLKSMLYQHTRLPLSCMKSIFALLKSHQERPYFISSHFPTSRPQSLDNTSFVPIIQTFNGCLVIPLEWICQIQGSFPSPKLGSGHRASSTLQKWSEKVLVAESCLTLCSLMDCSLPASSVTWDSPGKNTAVGSHSLLQGIFLSQGSNQVSCVAGRFFTISATREALTLFRDILSCGFFILFFMTSSLLTILELIYVGFRR